MPTLKQILGALEKQVLVGRTYLDTATGLLKADPVLLHVSPTFFGLTIDGSLELSQMAVARLYDETRRTITVPKMLRRAETRHTTGGQAGDSGLRQGRGRAGAGARRDPRAQERMARASGPADPKGPKALEARAKLTMPDLERVFKETERILLKLSSLYDGTISSELKYIGWDDYEVALNWIRLAKCAHIEKYEREFHTKWDGPRPKDCSRKDWE